MLTLSAQRARRGLCTRPAIRFAREASPFGELSMPRPAFANTLDHLPDEISCQLVGHTVEEIERELVLHTLAYHRGSRTRAASVLGISIRSLRNKINEYLALGITVPTPPTRRVGRVVGCQDSAQ
jgi:DNA-binding NtrC family response regulator